MFKVMWPHSNFGTLQLCFKHACSELALTYFCALKPELWRLLAVKEKDNI